MTQFGRDGPQTTRDTAAVMHFKIRHGAREERNGAPNQQIDDRAKPPRAGLVGADYPGLRPAFRVEIGDSVREGDVLFADRRHAEIAFVAPMTGRIAQIEYGPRRTLSTVVIEHAESEAAKTGDAALDDSTDEIVRQTLLARGFWPAFRTRPFGRIAEPHARPDAIFVNAVKGGTHAPDPAVVVERRMDAFRHGLSLLTKLTGGSVHLCQDLGADLCPNPPDGVRKTMFSGSQAAALAGTHVHRLHPVGEGGQVWTIGHQDVTAIGHLFATGRYDGARIIAIAGRRAARPRLVRTVLGADIRALTAGEATETRRGPGVEIVSGSALAGRPAAFVGRYDQQITIRAAERRLPGAWRRGKDAPRALIPNAALENALPFDVMPVPLMRALAVGDTEAAHRLGCLELVEEDVALLTRRCTSGADYGALLRGVLDEIAKDAA